MSQNDTRRLASVDGEKSDVRQMAEARHTTDQGNESSEADASRTIRFGRGFFKSKPSLSESPILDLLNCEDEDLKDQLTEQWRDNKLKELNFVGVVAALLTGCLTSTGSWPTILPTQLNQPWPIRTCWYVGIVFGLASILIAAAQTIRLHRVSAHRNACHRIRLLIKGSARKRNGVIRPDRLRMYMWQLPVTSLNASVISLISGLWVLVWTAPFEDPDGFGWTNNTKSATVFTVFGGVMVLVYFYSHHMLHREIHEEETEDTDE